MTEFRSFSFDPIWEEKYMEYTEMLQPGWMVHAEWRAVAEKTI